MKRRDWNVPEAGCWFKGAYEQLSQSGLRGTKPRKMVALSTFAGGVNRHFTAQELHRELVRAGSRLSLATVYNTLKSFSDAGMLRKIPVGDGNFFFDTNQSEHIHLITENEDGTHNIADSENLESAIDDLRKLARDGGEATVIRVVV